MKIEPKSRVSASPHVKYRWFGDELILVDLERGEYFGLDSVGGLVWTELTSGRSVEEAAARVATEYEASQADILRDCVALIEEMVGRGLLVAVES